MKQGVYSRGGPLKLRAIAQCVSLASGKRNAWPDVACFLSGSFDRGQAAAKLNFNSYGKGFGN
jgi:hypothetical protein